MFKQLSIVLFCFLCINAYCVPQWQAEENRVLQIARQENQPIVAVCYSVENCPWSQRLQEDVLDSIPFQEGVARQALLWRIALDRNESEFRHKYRIQVTPVILLLDPQGKEFARMEYTPLDAVGYVQEINILIENFQEVCLALEKEETVFDEEKWQDLYGKAKRFSEPYFKQVILEEGVQREAGTFFHLEKLASLLEQYKLKDPQVVMAKKQLLQLDPHNEYGVHFKVAVLEFNKALSRMKGKEAFAKPLRPLFEFVHRFGKTDKENAWKAELMIAKYLAAKNCTPQALEHAEAAYRVAPETIKPQIVDTIAYIKEQ